MLKEFIEHIQKTTQPLITTVNGSTFRITDDGNVKEILPTIFHPDTLDLNSLDALVTMVRTEASEMDAPLYIAVPDCKTVRCFGQSRDYDERCFRQVYYEAHATDVPGWEAKTALGFEEAQIALRTRFQETPDTLYAMKLVSDISLGAKVIYNDNTAAALGFCDGAIVDQKAMKDMTDVWSAEDHCKIPFIEFYGYDIQGAIYQAIEGNMLPFVLAVGTKEESPDLEALYIADEDLAAKLAEVEDRAPRYQAIKEGRIQPTRCEHCDYCKATKHLTAILNYKELAADAWE